MLMSGRPGLNVPFQMSPTRPNEYVFFLCVDSSLTLLQHSMWLSVQSLVYSLDILHVPNKATNPIEVKRDELQKMLQDYGWLQNARTGFMYLNCCVTASKIEPEDRAQMEKILQCQDTCKQLTGSFPLFPLFFDLLVCCCV